MKSQNVVNHRVIIKSNMTWHSKELYNKTRQYAGRDSHSHCYAVWRYIIWPAADYVPFYTASHRPTVAQLLLALSACLHCRLHAVWYIVCLDTDYKPIKLTAAYSYG